MTPSEQRRQMAAEIVNFEGRRDAAGHLIVYYPPTGDGGGAYEVAGINARYNRLTAKRLAGLIARQRYDDAERVANDFIARTTDCAAAWTDVPAVEFYLRDCVFSRGARGAALILQRALGVVADGKVGPVTRAAAAVVDPLELLTQLRQAREQYEREVVHRDERSKFWAGLSSRWDKAVTTAKQFSVIPAPAPVLGTSTTPPIVAINPSSLIGPDATAPATALVRSSNFPPRPAFPPLVTNRQREALFGRYDYVRAPRPGNPEAIRILGSWERDNIVEVPIPQLARALGAKAPAVIRFHRLAARQLQTLWEEWEAADLLNRIYSFDGGFVARFVRGSRSVLSNHAFGSAFDVNEAFNPFGQRPASNGRRGSVRDLVPIANRNGFYWGGHYQSRKDGMHFEVAVLQRKVVPQISLASAAVNSAAGSMATDQIAASAVESPSLPAATLPPAASV